MTAPPDHCPRITDPGGSLLPDDREVAADGGTR